MDWIEMTHDLQCGQYRIVGGRKGIPTNPFIYHVYADNGDKAIGKAVTLTGAKAIVEKHLVTQ